MTCYDSWWTGQDGSGSECPTDACHLSPARRMWTPNRMECCRNASQTGGVTECDVLSWPLPFPVAAVGVWMLAGHSAWCQDHTSSPWQTSAHVSRLKQKTAVTQSEPVERSHSVPWRWNTLPPLAFSSCVIVGAAVGNSVVSAAMNERECIHLFSLWWGCERGNGARLPTWLDSMSAPFSPGDFMPTCVQNCTVKAGFHYSPAITLWSQLWIHDDTLKRNTCL